MPSKIQYKISGSFLNGDKRKFNLEFPIYSSDKPIKSRQDARNHFLHLVELFKEEDSINPIFEENIQIEEKEFTLKLGIGVYVVIENKEYLIDYYGSFYPGTYDQILLGLEEEFNYFKINGYDLLETFQTTYCDYGEFTEGYEDESIMEVQHFKTSIDFSNKGKPYWWLSNQQKIDFLNKLKKEIELNNLNKLGENHFREFKPSLVYNFNSRKGSLSVKYHNARTICAFLNSSGGELFIGISDNYGIQGLHRSDFILAIENNKDCLDYVRLEFDQLMNYYFKPFVFDFVKADFKIIDGKDVFVVKVLPSDKPVFLKNKYEGELYKEFYIRTTASSILLSDPEEIMEYCLSHWR
jgi:hypothetical protein